MHQSQVTEHLSMITKFIIIQDFISLYCFFPRVITHFIINSGKIQSSDKDYFPFIKSKVSITNLLEGKVL